MSEDTKPKRRCQTGVVRPVLVEEFDPPVTLYVRTTTGRIMDLTERLRAVPDDDQGAALPVAVDFLQTALVDWKGVTDADGEALAFSREAVLELELDDAMTFLDAMQTMGERGSGNPTPATISEGASPEPLTP